MVPCPKKAMCHLKFIADQAHVNHVSYILDINLLSVAQHAVHEQAHDHALRNMLTRMLNIHFYSSSAVNIIIFLSIIPDSIKKHGFMHDFIYALYISLCAPSNNFNNFHR